MKSHLIMRMMEIHLGSELMIQVISYQQQQQQQLNLPLLITYCMTFII